MKEVARAHAAGQADREALRRIRAWLMAPALRRAGHLILRFFMGWVLSQARVFERYSPFGVGFAAAGGTGVSGLFGLLGTITGYMFLWEISDGLKYIAVSVLVFAAQFVFRETRAAESALFLPLVTLCSGGFVGIVFVAGDGFPITGTLLFLVEIILMSGSGYFFRIALERRPMRGEEGRDYGVRRLVSVLILISCVFLSMSHVTLFGLFSVPRFLSALLVMLFAYRNGLGGGAAAGLSMGLALDLSVGVPLFSMVYGFSGLLSGVFAAKGKLLCACSFVVSGAVSVLWTTDEALRLYVMLENFVASVLFMLIPETAFRTLPAVRTEQETALPRARRLREAMGSRLEVTAQIMKDLHDALVATYSVPGKPAGDNAAVVFDNAAERICRHCVMLGACWDREAKVTLDALSEAAVVMLRRGMAEIGDFPVNFSSRCLNFQRFVGAVNE